jgi:hypothetical protein
MQKLIQTYLHLFTLKESKYEVSHNNYYRIAAYEPTQSLNTYSLLTKSYLMESAKIFTNFTIICFLLILCMPQKLVAQFPTNCVFPSGQTTLCQQYGTATPQIQILTSTQSSSWLGNWTNQVVFINAEFKVNSAFAITNSILRFGVNGRIVVATGGTLNSSNSKYFGCAGWDGIQLEGNGILQYNDNWIEDAIHAITIKSSTSYRKHFQ